MRLIAPILSLAPTVIEKFWFKFSVDGAETSVGRGAGFPEPSFK